MRTPSTSLAPGDRLGPYTLGEVLGRGGYATVYAGFAPDGDAVALKVTKANDISVARRFLREFESLRLLRVPGVVAVHRAGIQDGCVWFSMARIDGEALLSGLEPLAPAARIHKATQRCLALCRILCGLHAAGFAHRDLKPSNVLVDAHDAVHLLDFGVSRFFVDEMGGTTDKILGTLPYMAPEQIAGLPHGPQADVFAAGLLLHEAIAGPPAPPASSLGWMTRNCLHRRTPLAVLFDEVPLRLSHLAERMTAVDPERRPTASQVVAELEVVGQPGPAIHWPCPEWVSPGSWAEPAFAVVEGGQNAVILEGPAGTGRKRLADQVTRVAITERNWVLSAQCRKDRVGWPVQTWFRQFAEQVRPALLDSLIDAEDFTPLSRLWPDIPLPRASDRDTVVGQLGLVSAAARVITSVVEHFRGLLVVHALEEVDAFTQEVLRILVVGGCRVLAIHDPRWATPRSRGVIRSMVADGATVLSMQPHEACAEITASLCPTQPAPDASHTTPLEAALAGWRTLAARRGEPFPDLPGRLGRLAPWNGVFPVATLREHAGRTIEHSPWLQPVPGGVVLAGQPARMMADAMCVDRTREAARLAAAWELRDNQAASPEAIARLWALAGDKEAVGRHAIAAARRSERLGLYRDAREWVLLAESLRIEPGEDQAFALAHAKARVALRTDPHSEHLGLLKAADRAATTEDEEQQVHTMRAEFALRSGQHRAALAGVLRVGASPVASCDTAARALLIAIGARLQLNDPDGASMDLARTQALLRDTDRRELLVQADIWEAEVAWHRRQLVRCRDLSLRNLEHANSWGYTRGEGWASGRLSAVLRMYGERQEAEAMARRAVSAFELTGDVFADTTARLALATLELERGEFVRSRRRLDRAIRHIRGLHLDHLLPTALAAVLRIATARADASDATLALESLQTHATEEAPAALVRWWRSRGDLDRALQVSGPDGHYGRTLWHLERARAHLVGGTIRRARQEARKAVALTEANGFVELELYGRLLDRGLASNPGNEWTECHERAASSGLVDLALLALELEARRIHEQHPAKAQPLWRALAARAEELGYHSTSEDAQAWLHNP